jgi:hypothetical protein
MLPNSLCNFVPKSRLASLVASYVAILTVAIICGSVASPAQERNDPATKERFLVGQIATVAFPSEAAAPELAGMAALMHGNAIVDTILDKDKTDPAIAIVELAARERDLAFVLRGDLSDQEVGRKWQNGSDSVAFGLLEGGTEVRVEEFAFNGTFASIITPISGSWSAEKLGVSPPRMMINSCYLHFNKLEAQLLYLRHTLSDPSRRCRR